MLWKQRFPYRGFIVFKAGTIPFFTHISFTPSPEPIILTPDKRKLYRFFIMTGVLLFQ